MIYFIILKFLTILMLIIFNNFICTQICLLQKAMNNCVVIPQTGTIWLLKI